MGEVIISAGGGNMKSYNYNSASAASITVNLLNINPDAHSMIAILSYPGAGNYPSEIDLINRVSGSWRNTRVNQSSTNLFAVSVSGNNITFTNTYGGIICVDIIVT